jgi:hypothetical protein
MKLSEWLEQNFKHVTFEENIGNLKVPKINVELTYGLLSTETKEEFQKLVFHLAPVGVIIDSISTDFYEGKLLLLRNMLTRMVMEEPNHKMADRFLNVLERRDKNHWAKDKKVTEIKAESVQDNNNNSPFNITFTVKE